MYLLLHLEEAYSPLTSPMETMVPLVPQRLLLLLLLQSLLLKLLLKILLLLLLLLKILLKILLVKMQW
jgi:hypothetical protein